MGVTAGAGEELMRLGSRPWPDMLAPCVAVPVSPLMSARSSSSRRSRRTGAPEHIASSLERSADRPAPRGPLRCQGQQPRPRRDALGARTVLGQGHQSRLREHQRQSRSDREQARVPRGLPAAALPRASGQLL
jgi:hypothetical protein